MSAQFLSVLYLLFYNGARSSKLLDYYGAGAIPLWPMDMKILNARLEQIEIEKVPKKNLNPTRLRQYWVGR
jgi:hypothetical protein